MGTEKDNKIDKNILEANIKLVDENKQLQQQRKKQIIIWKILAK